MRALFVIIAILIISCTSRNLTFIDIYLEKDIEWQKPTTGNLEIDTARMEANASIIIYYKEMYVKGKVSLYKENSNDVVYISYENGMIEFVYEGCFNGEQVVLVNDDKLSYQGEVYVQSLNQNYASDIKSVVLRKQEASCWN